MSSQINITLTATDDASATIASAGDKIEGSMNSVSDAGGKLTNSQNNTSGSTKDTALAMSNLATAGTGLVMGIGNVENANVSLDRAHLLVQKSTLANQKAHEALDTAVKKYGADSQEAKDASDKYANTQDQLTIAHEKVDQAQRGVNDSIMMFGVQVVPTAITMIGSISTLVKNFPSIAGTMSSAVEGISGAMDFLAANPIVLVIIGIVLLATALYEAYQNCKPFRDAVNEIGAVLGGALTTAFNTVKDALTYLWNNVFVPVGNFLSGAFNAAINVILWPINLLKTAFNDVKDALDWLWNHVLVPVGNFLKKEFTDAISGVMKFLQPLIDGVKTVINFGSSIGGAIGGALKTIGLAGGGIVTQPTLALIGEAGPEAVVPLGSKNSSIFGAAGVSPLNMNMVPTNQNGTVPSQHNDIHAEINLDLTGWQVTGASSIRDVLDGVTKAVAEGADRGLTKALNRASGENYRRQT